MYMYTFLVRLTNKSVELGILFLIRACMFLVKRKVLREGKAMETVQFTPVISQLSLGSL